MIYPLAFALGLIPGAVFGVLLNMCRKNKAGGPEKNPYKTGVCYFFFGLPPILLAVYMVYSLVNGTAHPPEVAMELGFFAGLALLMMYLARQRTKA